METGEVPRPGAPGVASAAEIASARSALARSAGTGKVRRREVEDDQGADREEEAADRVHVGHGPPHARARASTEGTEVIGGMT
jgi:hypothetical protein